MRLLLWNVQGETRRSAAPQVKAIAGQEPDIAVLVAVAPSRATELEDGLHGLGLEDCLASTDAAAVGPRRLGVMSASRWRSLPFRIIAPPWPEKVLSARIDAPGGPIELHGVYTPPGTSNGEVKVEVLDAVYRGLCGESTVPRILAGDFNTPRSESADGTVETWADMPGRDAEWDRKERGILEGLARLGMPDVFRRLHGPSKIGVSHYRGRTRVASRYDHVYASLALRPTRAEYLGNWLDEGLSDHAPLLVEFA